MSPTIDREEVINADVLTDFGNGIEFPAPARMPRGVRKPRLQSLRLKVIDASSLLSGAYGSRCDSEDEEESIADLASSIAALGMIEPIVVREAATGVYTVVAGERRLAAARLLNLEQVPCVVRECGDGEALMISLTENLQRNDLNPIEKAAALKRLVDDLELGQQEIGKRIGMSQSAIAHHLRLLALPGEILCLIGEGALSVGHGKVLAGVSDERKAVDMARECVAKNLSVRELEESLADEAAKNEQHRTAESSMKRREEHELPNGLFLVIKENRDDTCSGTIEIPYYSEREKEWVLEALSKNGTKQGSSREGAKPPQVVNGVKPVPLKPLGNGGGRRLGAPG